MRRVRRVTKGNVIVLASFKSASAYPDKLRGSATVTLKQAGGGSS
jgi:hypothetical protein